MGNTTTFEEELIRKGSIIYPNVGCSMLPLIRQGRDVLIIQRPAEWNTENAAEADGDTAEKLKRLDVPLYRRNDGSYVLHRVLKVRKKDYVICGDHCYRREYGVTDRQIIGVLTGVIRDGREISVRDFRYRLYSHLWCDFYPIRAGILRWKAHFNRRRSKSPAPGYISEVAGTQKIYIFLLLLAQILLGVSSVFYAVLLRGIIDAAVARSGSVLFRGLFLFGLLILGQIALGAVVRFVEELARSTYENAFKTRLFRELLGRDYAAVTATHSGEWMNRLTSDTAVVAEGLATILPGVAGMSARMAGALCMLLFLVPGLGWLLIPGGLLLILLTYVFRRRLKQLHKQMQEEDGRVRVFLQEHLSSLLTIKVFGREEDSLGRSAERMETHKKARLRKNLFSNLCNIGFGGVMNGAYLLGLIYSAAGIYQGTITYGTLMAVLQLIGQIQGPFANITGYLPKYYAMLASAERLMEVESYPSAITDGVLTAEEAKALYHDRLRKLVFDRVTFSYGKEAVLQEYSLEVEKGEYIAVTGVSGCGKSTLLKLLLGLYQPQEGFVGVELENGDKLPVSAIRRLFAYVPQGNYLMSGTIREVITFGEGRDRNKDSEERLRKAALLACGEFIYELPEGMDTVLGEKGAGLSEGQMQRIAIARALYAEVPLLILDEATSALDAATEEQLLKNLRQLTDMTVWIVTHRPQALTICDRKIVLQEES